MTILQECLDAINADDVNGPHWRGESVWVKTKAGRAKAYQQFRTILAESGVLGPDITQALKTAPFMQLHSNGQAVAPVSPVATPPPNGAGFAEAAFTTISPAPKAAKGHARPNIPLADDIVSRVVFVTNGNDLLDLTRGAVRQLELFNRAEPIIFTRGTDLVRLKPVDDGRVIIESLEGDALGYEVAEAMQFQSIHPTTGAIRIIPPPVRLLKNIQGARDLRYYFDSLLAISDIPIMHADGRLRTEPGFDRETKLYYQPIDGLVIPAIPEQPTSADVKRALRYLIDLIDEFAFDDPAGIPNTLGLWLTPIMRPVLGPLAVSPLFIMDARASRTGKGLLTDVIAITATGRPANTRSGDRSDEEWRKALFTALRAGATYIVLDNIEKKLGSDSLSQFLTSTTVRDRVLGVSEEEGVPNLATWIATGNNLSVSGDLVGRTVRIRQDAEVARPGLRRGPDKKHEWKYPNLKQHVIDHRGEILNALYTLVRAWIQAGRPRPGKGQPIIGGFELWSYGVGGVLASAGVKGFLGNLREDYDEADEESPQWESFLSTWFEVIGPEWVEVATVIDYLNPAPTRSYATGGWDSETIERVRERATDDEAAARELERRTRLYATDRLRKALPGDLSGDLNLKSFGASLGIALGKHERTRFGDEEYFIERQRDNHAKHYLYRVRKGGDES